MGLEEDSRAVLDEMKKNGSLPNLCKEAVLRMHEKGYEIVVGRIMLDNYCGGIGGNQVLVHYWTKDPDTGKNIDILSSQLNIHLSDKKKLEEIEIWEGKHTKGVYSPIKENITPYEVI